MGKVQECFKTEAELIKRAKKQAVEEGTNKSIVYRKAIIAYLEKNEKK